jgi:hypothetical protein
MTEKSMPLAVKANSKNKLKDLIAQSLNKGEVATESSNEH